MKRITLQLLTIISIFTLISCGENSAKQPATESGFFNIEKDIKKQFGDNAYFTNLSIIHDASIGNIISLTVTDNPESLKMGEWNQAQGTWKQNAEVTLEVPEGTKAADFMFQLNYQINLSKLGALIEQSKKQLQEEKNLDNPTLSIASIIFPKNGDISKTEYSINLKPENGGTTFRFYYTRNGELRKMDY
ncbi:hypothetical protein [uncultured Kordia sp.]|uniref:hypothetical protein n=1 Tax=uncultured Kordia sp. TaxID=507699 RepID=UPI00260E6F7B|nr:hypothetical protein [uncultured Kordia sp.]